VVNKHIAIIIVLYKPEPKHVERMEALSSLYNGIVVDNSPSASARNSRIGHMRYIFNNANRGIAEAQNIAIREVLRDQDIRHIVFLDQDSHVATDYPMLIVDEYIAQQNRHPKLAILGPSIYNADGKGKDYGSSIHKEKYIDDSLIRRDKIISSGSCVSAKVLRDVGLMDSRLFIDYVDSEWCWRANSKGYFCGITTRLRMSHRIGITTISMGPMRDIVSAPSRYFYQYRNYVWLLGFRYVPWRWKITNAVKSLVRFFYYPLFVHDGRQCARYMLKGLANGIKTLAKYEKNRDLLRGL